MRAALVALAAILATQAHAGGIAKDKQLHLAAGLVIGSTVTLIADKLDLPYPALWGSFTSILAGALKEAMDRRHAGNHWNGRDLAHTAGAGLVVSFSVRW